MKHYLCLIICCCALFACGGPEPRRPVEVRSGSFMKESVSRNKALLAREEELIKHLIASDSAHEYHSSSAGSWYYYRQRNEQDSITPEPGDLVTLQYDILSLENDTIYAAEEIGTVSYLVDKEDKEQMFPGLRHSVKLLAESESATFLYPSSLAYGYLGDKRKIGPNIPLKSTITLLKIEKQQDSLQN
jgi:gliding motility-associated peptidyl-prolyl isomerase